MKIDMANKQKILQTILEQQDAQYVLADIIESLKKACHLLDEWSDVLRKVGIKAYDHRGNVYEAMQKIQTDYNRVLSNDIVNDVFEALEKEEAENEDK